MTRMIKVLLADDSLLTRTVLRETFTGTDDIIVAGEAANGREAIDLAAILRPDLIVMDLMMPVLDGISAIEEIMESNATPILVLSATVDDREVGLAFSAIKKGALDVMEKPGILGDGFADRIIEKVRLLSRIRVIRRPKRREREPAEPAPSLPASGDRKVLAIGASTGGPKAVKSIVGTLPRNFPGAVFIVQHIASGFARGFAQWLDSESSISVRLARDGDGYEPGVALVAPNDCHMIVEKGRVTLVDFPPVNCCRPSIDVFFESLARERGAESVGVLLTGMGKDGALGLSLMRERGGVTIVQDEESCIVFGMPKAAIALRAADDVLPLGKIPEAVANLFTPGGIHGAEENPHRR
jgi:two-component system, chemotaxis family, protein-glutamate methylesterase/glutaminase